MAAPSIRSQAGNNTAGSGVTTVVVTLPATIESGDRLVVAVSADGATGAFTWPMGWNVRAADIDGADTSRTEVAEKVATGSEDGTTINVGLTNTQLAAWRAWAIQDAHASQAIEVSTVAQQAFGTTVNPNSVTASWGAEDNLFFVIAGYDNGTRAVTGYSANYTTSQNNDRDNTAQGAGLASCFRALTAASDDPGNVTIDTSDSLVAWTFVIRPAAAATGWGQLMGNDRNRLVI